MAKRPVRKDPVVPGTTSWEAGIGRLSSGYTCAARVAKEEEEEEGEEGEEEVGRMELKAVVFDQDRLRISDRIIVGFDKTKTTMDKKM
tara:strand:+ start:1128 stop:1391 length:264 start_codon:yes stop_codon:yes gene_type:complete